MDSIDLTFPCWEDYADALEMLAPLCDRSDAGITLPDAQVLQNILSHAATNQQGQSIEFVSSSSLPEGNYEEQIFSTGRVSTRNNWHDLFNALVWSRFPGVKAAMNALHVSEMRAQSGSERGKLRDALTLWDECGVIVASSDQQLLDDLAHRRWQRAFRDRAQVWKSDASVFVCGHALLEKYLQPYKSITANALLVKLDTGFFDADRVGQRECLDNALASKLLKHELLASTADLSPLPLAGIPGWWAKGEQNDAFYADDWVFRKPPESFSPVRIVSLEVSTETE